MRILYSKTVCLADGQSTDSHSARSVLASYVFCKNIAREYNPYIIFEIRNKRTITAKPCEMR